MSVSFSLPVLTERIDVNFDEVQRCICNILHVDLPSDKSCWTFNVCSLYVVNVHRKTNRLLYLLWFFWMQEHEVTSDFSSVFPVYSTSVFRCSGFFSTILEFLRSDIGISENGEWRCHSSPHAQRSRVKMAVHSDVMWHVACRYSMLWRASCACVRVCAWSVVWLLYVCLTAVHLYANYRAVTAVTMDTFNQSRLHIVISHWLTSRQVLSVTQANQREPVFTGTLSAFLPHETRICIAQYGLLQQVCLFVCVSAALVIVL